MHLICREEIDVKYRYLVIKDRSAQLLSMNSVLPLINCLSPKKQGFKPKINILKGHPNTL